MSEEVELLSKEEYETVGEMFLNLITKCPYIPEGLKLQFQNIETGESIGVFTLPNARVLEWYISGGFTAQLNFRVEYKSFPTGNDGRIESQSVVDNIMNWLEKVDDLPFLSDDRKITEIIAYSSVAYVDSKGEDKSTTFAADAVMKYKKKGV